MTQNKRQAALFVVPSVIYWLHNNVQFLTLQYVDAPTYQILGNLKIVTTGLLFYLWLRRRLTPLQWMALVLLMIGAATSQVVIHIVLSALQCSVIANSKLLGRLKQNFMTRLKLGHDSLETVRALF